MLHLLMQMVEEQGEAQVMSPSKGTLSLMKSKVTQEKGQYACSSEESGNSQFLRGVEGWMNAD